VKTKPEILSKSDFAELIGVRPNAISNYIARGQIYGDALPASGGISVESAKMQLAFTVDPIRSLGAKWRIW
jgi:hypothetical protein